jgi:hypothetical protein
MGVGGGGISLAADGLEAGRIFAPFLEARGTISLFNARISSDLEMNGARLSPHNGLSVLADRLQVGGAVKFRDGFWTDGNIRLNGAKIAGHLDIGNPSIPFLNLADASVQT